jgi:hypothetical protein
VSGQCRGSVGAVSVDTGVARGVEQCRSSVGAVSEQCRGLLTLYIIGWRQAVSECRSVGVSESVSRGVSRSVGVSECRSVGVSECRSVGWVSLRWVIVSSSDEMLWIWMSQ